MIDPKQKALDIRFKYWHELDLTTEQATECAKIAVNEIIEVLSISAISISHRIQEESYWQEVLNELNKM